MALILASVLKTHFFAIFKETEPMKTNSMHSLIEIPAPNVVVVE